MESLSMNSSIPPSPQKINDHANGHVIGHYMVKKALSVALYNHYCSQNFIGHEEVLSKCEEQQALLAEDEGMEDTQTTVSSRKDCISINELFQSSTNIKEEQEEEEYISPVISNVLMNTSAPKVHLRKPNTLTFDSRGSSKTLDLIVASIAEYLDAPYARCDCRKLSPIKQNQMFATSQGLLGQLMSGSNGETINKVISNLYRKAEFDLEKAQRGIILLDGMDRISPNFFIRDQVFKEILRMIEGCLVDVSRAKGPENKVVNEVFDTSKLFFVCFGVSENSLFGSISKPSSRDNLNNQSPTSSSTFSSRRSSNLTSSDESMTTVSKHSQGSGSKKRKEDFLQQICSEYEDDDDDEDFEDYFASLEEEGRELEGLLEDNKSTPLSQCQSLWGMKNVNLKLTPEAKELIANQALYQNAGSDGVTTILEQLFLNIKFDILGSPVSAVEVTELTILGKERPTYYNPNGEKVQPMNIKHLNRRHSFQPCNSLKDLSPITEESSLSVSDPSAPSQPKCDNAEKAVADPLPTPHRRIKFTDFEMSVIGEMEL